MGAEQCCRPIESENDYQPNLHPNQHSNNHKQDIILYLGLFQQLASINYQIKMVRSNRAYLTNISNYFHSMEQLLQLIDANLVQSPPLLTSLQSRLYDLNSSRFDRIENRTFINEVCVVSNQSNSQQQGKRDNVVQIGMEDVKVKLKILEYLRVTKQELDNQKEFINSLISTLLTIPESQTYLWDIQPKSTLTQMGKHLLYKLPSYIEYVNSYVSLNDPISLLNLKYFMQIALRFMAGKSQSVQQLHCRLNLNDLERMLVSKRNTIMTVNFLKFQKKQKGKETAADQVLLILKDDKPQNYRMRHASNIYLLSFTLFQITQVIQSKDQTKIYIRQLNQQPLLNLLTEFKSNSVRSKQQHGNYVAIHQLNLLTQLQSLRHKHKTALEKYVGEVRIKYRMLQEQKKPEFVQLIYKHYQKYLDHQESNQFNNDLQEEQDELKSERTKIKQIYGIKGKPQLDITEGQEDKQALQVIEPSVASEYRLKQMNPSEIKRCEKTLNDYIKRLKLEKLQNQLLAVDIFYNLTTLNLSHSFLQYIDHLDCFPNLRELFLYSNEISKIEGLQSNGELRLLSLSRNKIEKLENIEHLVHLKELYVTKNRLRRDSAQYLVRNEFKSLRKLAISFVGQQDECFELLCKQAVFNLKKLIINESQNVQLRSQNKLKKRFKAASIQFYH